MTEKSRSLERYAVTGLAALVAGWGLKKAVEHMRDTPERRQAAYQSVISTIDEILLSRPNQVRTLGNATALEIPSKNGLFSISRSLGEAPTYKVDSFNRYHALSADIHNLVELETDGITGTRRVFTGLALAAPSQNPREPWVDHRVRESDWAAGGAKAVAAMLTHWNLSEPRLEKF